MVIKGKGFSYLALMVAVFASLALIAPRVQARPALTNTNMVAKLVPTDESSFSQNQVLFYDPSECAIDRSAHCNNIAIFDTLNDDDPTPTGEVDGSQITFIGDSIVGMAGEEMFNQFFEGADYGPAFNDCNGAGASYICSGKDVYTSYTSQVNPGGISILEKIVEKGELRPILVFELGGNSPSWQPSELEQYMDKILELAGPNTQIVLFTNYWPECFYQARGEKTRENYKVHNEFIRQVAREHDNVIAGDWASVGKDELYDCGVDNMHPTYKKIGSNDWNGFQVFYKFMYDTIANIGSKKCGAGHLRGDNIFEKVWNRLADYFDEQDMPDVDITAVISGIMGNFMLETGVKPYLDTGSAAGMHMLIDSNGRQLVTLVNEEVGTSYWHPDIPGTRDELMERLNIPESAMDKNIDIQIQIITGSGPAYETFASRVPKSYYDVDIGWGLFMKGIREWGIADTPRGYSDLFLATVERAYPCNSGPCAAIEDPGVVAHLKEINTNYGSSIFQASEKRRVFADEIYEEYASQTTSSVSNHGNSTGGSSAHSSGTVNLTSNGSVTNYAGDEVWTKEQLEIVKKNQAIYESSAEKVNIPWQLLATLHRLEFGLKKENPSNGQGIYQLYSYTSGGTNSNAFLPAGPVDDKEFQRQTDIAAQVVRDIINSGGYDPNSEDGAKFLIFKYNGTASQYISKALAMGFSQEEAKVGEGSPYVMNRYDAQRDPNSKDMSPLWPGRFVADGVYDSSSTAYDFGGFVLYSALAGLGWPSAKNNSQDECTDDDKKTGNGGELIAQVARDLAWPDNNHHSVVKPEFAEAAKKVGSPTNLDFAQDCGHFVSVVVRYAEIDGEYPEGGTPNFESHMHKSDLWEEIANNGSEETLKPGDIFVRNTGSGGFGSDIYPAAGFGAGGHIYIYLGENEIASASLGSRTGNLDKGIDFSNYRIFRSTVNTNSPGGTIGSFDEGLKELESSGGIQVGVAVSAPGNKDASKVQVGGSWKGGRAWSTIKVPLSIAAIQKNASTGSVTDPYGGSCSHSLDSAVNKAITQSDNCAAWWLWQALGGDNSSAAGSVTNVINAGGDSSTSVASTGDGQSLTSGRTTWSLIGQAIFMSNITSIDGANKVISTMKTHNAGDGSHGLNTFTSITKGGWGSTDTRQLGIIKLDNGKCSAVAIGTNRGSDFSILDKIAQVIKNHQDDLPSGTCPGGL